MGKDKEAKFHPAKGKPSGAGRQEGLGLRRSLDPADLERDEQMTARYTPLDADQLSPDVHVRHPNRNISAGNDIARPEDPNYLQRHQATDQAAKTDAEELPGIIHKDLFNFLASYQADPCISILLPTHSAGVEVNEQMDLVAFKNCIQQVEKTLQQKGTGTAFINKLLQPAYGLLRDEKFWKQQGSGLAVYVADGFFKFLRLAGPLQKEVLVNSTFSVSGLLPFMVKKEFFYILVINKKNPALYRADGFGIEHIPVDEMPTAVDDVVHFENKDDHNLFRAGSGGKGGANYHGIGSGKPDDKKNIAAYLEEIDKTIWQSHLHYSTAPLLLAGLDHYIPIYRSVSKYRHIWKDALTGNHQHEETGALHRSAMELMKPYFGQALQRALDDYGLRSNTPLTSNNVHDIIPASFYGRVARLFVPKDAHIWGTFDKDSNELKLFNEEQENAENLADRAAAKTIQNGGEVFVLEKNEMPGAGELIAVYRY